MSTPTTEPVSFTSGDTVAWLRTLDDYPASSSWVLAYTFINGAAKFTVTAAASGRDHAVAIAASASAGYPPGTYTWQATVTKSAERYTVGTGTCQVLPNLEAASQYDTRTPARKALDAAEVALATYGAKAYLQSYDIAGRSQRFHDPGAFLAWRDKLKAEVRREEAAAAIAAGRRPRNQLLARFNTR
jgi:hypothetical protein